MKTVGVGVGIILIRNDRILLLKRKREHGSGTWSTPGGHLEFGQEIEECARQEAKEETGIDIEDIKFLSLTNDIFPQEDKHYITIWVTAEALSDNAQNLEPHMHEEIGWFAVNKLPEPLFIPLKNLISQGIKFK